MKYTDTTEVSLRFNRDVSEETIDEVVKSFEKNFPDIKRFESAERTYGILYDNKDKIRCFDARSGHHIDENMFKSMDLDLKKLNLEYDYMEDLCIPTGTTGYVGDGVYGTHSDATTREVVIDIYLN